MNSPLSFLFGRDSNRPAVAAAKADVASQLAVDPAQQNSRPSRHASPPLDGIGQRNEILRVRIAEMSGRLSELQTLTDDFSLMIDPIEAIAEELPKAKGRILELEALITQEMESGQALRREVDSLLGQYSVASSDLSTSTARASRLEILLREQEAVFDEQRLTLREKTTHADGLERQLLAEVEQTQSLSVEVKTLRAEAKSSDQALADAERMLGDLGEQRHMLDQESRRLQVLAEDQSAMIVTLNAKCDELEQLAETNLQTIATLETQAAAETLARQRATAQHEADLGALRTERSSSTMKMEALIARLAATDQILVQVRNQLRDREEAIRIAERSGKEAVAERSASERRADSLRTDAARLSTQLQNSEKVRNDLESRCDMLVKALAAKDAAVDDLTTRSTNLSDRIEALSLRFEQDRLALEATNRRLIEELQNERAERTLAQGALDIARESRTALQRQNESLKRATRARHGDPAFSATDTSGEVTQEELPSNVRPFRGPGDE